MGFFERKRGHLCVNWQSWRTRQKSWAEVAGGSHPQFVISTMKQNGRSSQLLLKTYSIRTKLKAYVWYVHRQLGVSVTKSNLMNSRTNVKSWWNIYQSFWHQVQRRKMKLKHCLQITILITLLITDYYQGNEFFPLGRNNQHQNLKIEWTSLQLLKKGKTKLLSEHCGYQD